MVLARGFILVLAAFIAVMPVGIPSDAEAILIASEGTAASPGESNSTGGATVAVPPNAGWAPALPGSVWVSFAIEGGQTGDPGSPGFTVVTNGTQVLFSETFTLPESSAPYAGTLIVMADDTTSVLVDGVTVMDEAAMAGNTYTVCSDFPIGCREVTRAEIPLLLASGEHTFSFNVAQRNGVSFGLDYSGDFAPVPEPGTMLLLGSGLIGVGAALRRRVSGKK